MNHPIVELGMTGRAIIDGRAQQATLEQLGCPASVIEEIRMLNAGLEKRTVAPAVSPDPLSTSSLRTKAALLAADYDARHVPSTEELKAKAARLAASVKE